MSQKNNGSAERLRVGIAGLGRSGWGIHGEALSRQPEAYHVTHVADADESRRREAAQRFDCQTHEHFEQLIRQPDIDLIVVATPNHLHPDHAMAALRAGKHIVCEKPMARSTIEADQMIAVAERANKTLAIFQNQRYAPHLQQVKKLIEAGALGRIVQIRIACHDFSRRWDWQTLRRFDGGTLSNTGPHFLDFALQVFGDHEPELFCHLDRTLTLGDADDHDFLVLRAAQAPGIPGAPLVQLELSSACAYGQDLWHIMGTRGGLRGSAQELHWRIADFSHLPPRRVEEIPPADRTYNSEEIRWTQHQWTVPKEQSTPQWTHDRFYEDLHRTIRYGAPLTITPQSIRRQIAVIEQCRAWERDYQNGSPITQQQSIQPATHGSI